MARPSVVGNAQTTSVIKLLPFASQLILALGPLKELPAASGMLPFHPYQWQGDFGLCCHRAELRVKNGRNH